MADDEVHTRIVIQPGKKVTFCDVVGCIEVSVSGGPIDDRSMVPPEFHVSPGGTVFPAMLTVAGSDPLALLIDVGPGDPPPSDATAVEHVYSDPVIAGAALELGTTARNSVDLRIDDLAGSLDAERKPWRVLVSGPEINLRPLVELHRAALLQGHDLMLFVTDP